MHSNQATMKVFQTNYTTAIVTFDTILHRLAEWIFHNTTLLLLNSKKS